MAAAKALQNPFEKKEAETPEKEEKAAAREGDVEVKLDDDEDDEDEGEEEAASKPSWKEKKRNRYAERIREAEEAKREAEQARQEIAQLRQQQSQIVQAIQPQVQDGPEQYLQRVREYKRQKAQEFNTLMQKPGAMTPELEKSYWDELERVNDAEAQALYHINQARDPRNDPAYQHNQQIIAWLQSNHSDVMEHPRREEIILAARGKLMQHIAQRKGRMGDFASYERALSETKADFGLARRPANSSNGMQAKLAGVPRGGGAGEPTRSMRLTKDEQKMAEARYRGIAKSPEQAYQMWAKDVQKQREKKARAGE